MKKAKVYFGLVAAMFLLGLGQAVSGFVLWLAFATGAGGGRHGGSGIGESTFWALSRHTWIDIHDWVGVALLVVVTVHIVLHWKWIARMLRLTLVHLEKKGGGNSRLATTCAG